MSQSVPPPDAKRVFKVCMLKGCIDFRSGLLELGSANNRNPEPGETLGRMWFFVLLSKAFDKPSFKFLRVFFSFSSS